MKTHTIILSVISFSLFSCKNEKVIKKEEPLKSKITTTEIVNETINPEFSQNDFTMVYQYSDGEYNQTLGINIVDKKALKFHLITETLPCDTEYWGIAENKNLNNDPEIKKDKNGDSFAKEYFSDKIEYRLGIKLSSDSSKVVIEFVQKDGLETDCLPITEETMNRIK